MSNPSKSSVAFVRHDQIPAADPPMQDKGALKWLRENLFSSWFNALLTILSVYFIVSAIWSISPWIFNGVGGTSSLKECREILDGVNAACWSVLQERWNQLVFGFTYPVAEYWRPTLALVLLIVCVLPVLFSKLPRKLLVLTFLYPFVGFWLIWGGTLLYPAFIALGVVAAYFAFSTAEKYTGFLVSIIVGIIAAAVVIYIGGIISGMFANVLALESIPSRDMGGFMLNLILGTVCVSLSLPLGILLALGRQSSMPIIKGICVVIIEFVRGVPLITLLFVANVVLAYFFPPGTNMDLILRVIIMMTIFSSAYIAEVIRGGLAALPRGQYEAADSLGLDYAQSMRLIILPQALKISIPGIVNVAVGLFKDTTLVSVISMFDLVGMIRGPVLGSADWTGIYWEVFIFAIILFFIVCYAISKYSQWLERQLATDRR